MRGHNSSGIITLDERSDDEPPGLFMKFFEYTLLKNEKLRSAFASIPKNAAYKSPMIQNEMVEILKETVIEKVVADINASDINGFTLKADSTRDPINVENVLVVIRFVKEEKAYETLIGMPLTEKFNANAITSVLLVCINSCGIDSEKMISQCYDGAAVMSGRYDGVPKKIQETLNKRISYVHYFNYQLHLVVVHALKAIDDVKRFFDSCSSLYNFIRRLKLFSISTSAKLKVDTWRLLLQF